MKIYFVTGNEKKARETKAIMPNVERINIDLPEIQSLDPKEVLEAKLKVAHNEMPNKTLVVEDVTYSIDGLKGLPGTLIKWFVQTIGPEGIYDLVKDKDCRTTVAANLGVIKPSGEMIFVKGEVIGKTVEPDKLGDGFHFDNIFLPDGYDLRYSEMTKEQKNKISHRAKAWQELKKHI
jgi:non-canonical purine NTP pyrophosphatase (RdgB/HAM1 family)